MTENFNQLKALTLICTLTPSPGESSSDKIAHDVDVELSKYNVINEFIRVVDYNVKPGVETDMGDGDEWPLLRQKMLEADIFIIATPTWVGQMSSVALRIIERLDAELSETDNQGRLLTFGKVAAVAIVGNEDGAHKITADVFQGLNDLGFTIPAQAATYWNGEAMHKVDYKDLPAIPEKVASANATLARNVAHMAHVLKSNEYPAGQ
jgi:multimeric flavodoxin WrbA